MAQQKFPKDIQKAVDQIQGLRKQLEAAIKAASRCPSVAKDMQSRLKEQDARFDKETKGTPVLRNLLDIARKMDDLLRQGQEQMAQEIDRADREETDKRVWSELCTAVRSLGALKANATLHERMSKEVKAMADTYDRARKERDHGRAGDMFIAMEKPMKELQGRLRDAAKVADVVEGALEALFKRTQTAVNSILAGGAVRAVFNTELLTVREALDKAATQLNAAAVKSAVADRLKKLELQAWRIQEIWSKSRDVLIAAEKSLKDGGSPKDLMQWYAAIEKGRYDWAKHKTPRDMVVNVEAWMQDLQALAAEVRREVAKA